MESAMTPIEALQAVCEAWTRLDNDALADLFADEGLFDDPLNDGIVRGREEVRAVAAPAMQALAECHVTLESALESGDLGLGEGTFRSRLADGQGRMDFSFALAVEMREGRIARLTEYFDTAPLV
jgi:ketosteroid isomerase-like protein